MRTELLWEFPLTSEGVGGIVASEDMVVVSGRDINDQSDEFFVLNAENGGLITKHQYLAAGMLDYGNTPRATPVIGSELVYGLGAFGHLIAIDPVQGRVRWEKHLVNTFGGRRPTWGYCASPLLVDDLLIVQPGGLQCSIVALDALTGAVRWQSASQHPSAYASPSLILSRKILGNETSIVACDQVGMFGCSLRDGRELWRVLPKEPGEFMVPSPIVVNDAIYWLGENNGMRRFVLPANNGVPSLIAQNSDVTNDTHSPIYWGGRIVSISDAMVLLDPESGLKVVDRLQHKSLDSYSAMMTESDRALICCSDGTLLLVKLINGKLQLVDQSQPHRNEASILSQPAFCNGLLYIRKTRSIVCYRLEH
ncbi:MAG: PQQ-binding-like beta-propeller repeat protein [Pirellula sp.]